MDNLTPSFQHSLGWFLHGRMSWGLGRNLFSSNICLLSWVPPEIKQSIHLGLCRQQEGHWLGLPVCTRVQRSHQCSSVFEGYGLQLCENTNITGPKRIGRSILWLWSYLLVWSGLILYIFINCISFNHFLIDGCWDSLTLQYGFLLVQCKNEIKSSHFLYSNKLLIWKYSLYSVIFQVEPWKHVVCRIAVSMIFKHMRFC